MRPYNPSLENRLVNMVASALTDIGVNHLQPELKQTRFCDYLPFKLSERRTVCYIQFQNKTLPEDTFNLVLRLKRGDRPSSWTGGLTDNELHKRITGRFIRPWSEERGYPKGTWNDTGPTQQFAIDLGDDDLAHADFEASLKLLLRISHAAVTRDWASYDALTQA